MISARVEWKGKPMKKKPVKQIDLLTAFEDSHIQMFKAMSYEDLKKLEIFYRYLLNLDIPENHLLKAEINAALGLIKIEISTRE